MKCLNWLKDKYATIICVVCYTLSALVVSFILTGYGFIVCRTQGHSMDPTLDEKHIYIVYNIPGKDYEVGDIVMINNFHGALREYTDNKWEFVAKRIVAKAGDKVTVVKGYVYVNDKLLEDYEFGDCAYYAYTNFEVTLKENEYFVLGDNRNSSVDSRRFGPVTSQDINGLFLK